MTSSRGTPKSELTIIEWLKKQLEKYSDMLLDIVASKSREDVDVIALLTQLIKAEVTSSANAVDRPWISGTFASLVYTLLRHPSLKDERAAFVNSYVDKYDDVRYYFFHVVSRALDDAQNSDSKDYLRQNALDMLSSIEGNPDSDEELENFFGGTPEQKKHKLMSLSAHKKVAESAWLALLRTSLDKDQRKTVLRVMTDRIVPWFNRTELLMDFLTDSYDLGGATSLLALSGLFHLMQEKNLDYPSFFSKLYSLLDQNLLHSKHRSRFFRLLNTFMSSTHLPAALVASFIERLARLALHGPPAGIVVVVPWIYNMLKSHPSCTFMIHRHITDPEDLALLAEEGMDDPYDMSEPDPVKTGAIDSSLWEIETLQSHYHPNVATLARIIGEQFTKQSYNLEDFLDHSYHGLIEGELGREVKRTPVVEWQIPKDVFEGRLGSMMEMVLQEREV